MPFPSYSVPSVEVLLYAHSNVIKETKWFQNVVLHYNTENNVDLAKYMPVPHGNLHQWDV